jgi:hypothetical protein
MSKREPTRPGVPDLVRPMLAIPGELPAAGEDARWAYELKWGFDSGETLRGWAGWDVDELEPVLGVDGLVHRLELQ